MKWNSCTKLQLSAEPLTRGLPSPSLDWICWTPLPEQNSWVRHWIQGVIINSLKVPKIKKILLYEMRFIVANYSCLQNPWLGGYLPPPRSPFIPSFVLNWICWTTPRNKIPGYATGIALHRRTSVAIETTVFCLSRHTATGFPVDARKYHQQPDLVTIAQQARWRWKHMLCDMKYFKAKWQLYERPLSSAKCSEAISHNMELLVE